RGGAAKQKWRDGQVHVEVADLPLDVIADERLWACRGSRRCSRSIALQPDVAEVDRGSLAIRVEDVPAHDTCKVRGRAVDVGHLVEADADLVLAGLQPDRHDDARLVIGGSGVNDS